MADAVNTYEAGNIIRLNGQFIDALTGAVYDPIEPKLVFKLPSGTSTEYPLAQLIKLSTGVYYKDILVTATGRYSYKFVSANAADAASKEQTFVVI